jgi:hypothetical protein
LHTLAGEDDAVAFGRTMMKITENSGFSQFSLCFGLWRFAEYNLLNGKVENFANSYLAE